MTKMRSNVIRMLIVISLAAITHVVAEVCEMLDQCSCKKENGKIISLWGIDGGSKEPA